MEAATRAMENEMEAIHVSCLELVFGRVMMNRIHTGWKKLDFGTYVIVLPSTAYLHLSILAIIFVCYVTSVVSSKS